ncbi:hypothetical protein MGSAQ_001924, partial [marine sediment metagenome]
KLCPSSSTVDDAIMVTVNRALALFLAGQHRSGRWQAGVSKQHASHCPRQRYGHFLPLRKRHQSDTWTYVPHGPDAEGNGEA